MTTFAQAYYRVIEHFCYLTTRFELGDTMLILPLANPVGVTIEDVADVWDNVISRDRDAFVKAVSFLIGDDVAWCTYCDEWLWQEDATTLPALEFLCEPCRDRRYSYCVECETWTIDENTTTVDSTTYCDTCADSVLSFCDVCDERYHPDDAGEHDHEEPSCGCEAPRQRFSFPANGDGTVDNDERLTVKLPAGTITDEGLIAVGNVLHRMAGIDVWDARKVVGQLDPLWQKRQGNFTRRLSKAVYKELGRKLAPEVISEVGNVARRHTSTVSEAHIEFTRNLNLDAEDFYNEDSCWWGSHSASRCALKNWGGLGIRSYDSATTDSYMPSGRAWIQPLNADLRPTHDALGAHAYVVYNGYGDLDGYHAARIVAHLTGRTYRKVDLSLDPQYVNGSSGFLIADEATCEINDSVEVSAGEHRTFDVNFDMEEAA